MVASRYRLSKYLGEGATAETWLARDQLQERSVALKLFRQEWSQSHPDAIDAEFRTLSRLNHPYLAAIHDFGVAEEVFFLASEAVEGPELLEALAVGDLHRTVWVFSQLLETLDYLYFRNVVHLDLKPANILLSSREKGMVKLLDFGLSQRIDAAPVKTQALGTPPFTAPEFALRRGIDTRSDLYSVGVMLYMALTQRPPFSSTDPIELLNRQIQSDPPPPRRLRPDIPGPLSDFVLRLMARDPLGRPANPHLALSEFHAVLGEAFPVTPVAPIPIGDDPELVFHPEILERVAQGLAKGEARWALEGGRGTGKSFLLQALQRRFWEQGKSVLLWSGDSLPLLESGTTGLKDSIVLIDDADRGPVESWLRAHPGAQIVIAGRDLKRLDSTSLHWARLEPVKHSVLERSLAALFGEIDRNAASRLARICQGVPGEFLAYLRQLASQGIVTKSAGHWRLEGKLVECPNPSGLLQILQASEVRLDPATLASLAGLSSSEVEASLEDLARDGLASRHLKAGKVVYSSLSAAKTNLSMTQAQAMAGKYFESGRYREGIALLEKFAHPSEGSASELLYLKLLSGAGDHQEIFRRISSARLKAAPAEHQALLLELIGKSYLFTGNSDEAKACLEQAGDHYRDLGDLAGACRVAMHLGIAAQRAAGTEEARKFYHQAADLAARAKSPLLQGAVALNLGNLEYDASHFDEAEARYGVALESLRRAAHGPLLAQACLNLGNFSYFAGQRLRAQHLAREALRIAIEHRFFLTQGRALLLLATLDASQGNFQGQRERLDQAVEIFARSGLEFETAQALIHRAYFLEAQGETKGAEQDARAAQDGAERVQALDLQAQAKLILAKLLGKDPALSATARDLFASAWIHLSRGSNRLLKWECLALWGEWELARGERRFARQQLSGAIREMEEFLAALPENFRESYQRDGKLQRLKSLLQNTEDDS